MTCSCATLLKILSNRASRNSRSTGARPLTEPLSVPSPSASALICSSASCGEGATAIGKSVTMTTKRSKEFHLPSATAPDGSDGSKKKRSGRNFFANLTDLQQEDHHNEQVHVPEWHEHNVAKDGGVGRGPRRRNSDRTPPPWSYSLPT